MTRAIVTTGSVSEVSASPGSAQSSWGNPPAGSTPRWSANTVISSMPTQKTGTAMPSCDNALSTEPYQVLAR